MTKSQKRQLASELLAVANNYEIKQRKFLKNIRFTNSSAHWSGQAHNYSAHL
jgi:hypothetical protein